MDSEEEDEEEEAEKKRRIMNSEERKEKERRESAATARNAAETAGRQTNEEGGKPAPLPPDVPQRRESWTNGVREERRQDQSQNLSEHVSPVKMKEKK